MSVANKIVLRRCRVCRTQQSKAELTRWVLQEGELVEDPLQQQPGRGFYTDSIDCAARLAFVIKKTGR